MTPAIRALDAEAVRRERAALAGVLGDAVRDGASVGFMAPVDPAGAVEQRELSVQVKVGEFSH